MPELTDTQNDAIKALDGMLAITENEMLVRGVYVTQHIVNEQLAAEGAICQGRQACAVGSLWIGGGIQVANGRLPGVEQGRDRVEFLRERPGLKLAYDAMNQVSGDYIEAEKLTVSREYRSPMEALFEARDLSVSDDAGVSPPLIDAGVVFPLLIGQAKGLVLSGEPINTATAGDAGTATAGYGGTATAGDAGTATAGYGGTATAGYGGTATAGYAGTATAGDAGTATAGDAGTATAGDAGTATAGYAGTATAGDAGTATAGYAGTATAGYAGTATAGYDGTATAGDAGTATAGYAGTATAGYDGTATAGYAGTATAGNRGTATAGNAGTATAGNAGTATAGYAGTATAGDGGTATAGYDGTATAGYDGTATAGYAGTATAGNRGTATAGNAGTILLRRWNGKRYRWTLGEIGETPDAVGAVLEANVAYKLDDDGKFIRSEIVAG